MTVDDLVHAEEHELETWLSDRPALDPYIVALVTGAAFLLMEVFVPTLKWVLLLTAFVLFALSAAGVTSRVNLTAAGLACWVLTLLF